MHEVLFNPALLATLAAVAPEEGASTAVATLAAFSATLAAHRGTSSALLGMFYANRQVAELEDVVGFCAIVLLIPWHVAPGITFRIVSHMRRVGERPGTSASASLSH
jgi:non-ribosomal peptide synthetase component F